MTQRETGTMNKRIAVKLDKINDILTLADAGEPRPQFGTPLGNALSNYTSPRSLSYDPAFAEVIKAQRPDWFGRGSKYGPRDGVSAEEAKKRMIEMALNRETIDVSHRWYHRLRRYTNPVSRCYDAEFAKLTMILAPEWSLRSRKRVGDAATNKKAILMAASAGWDKPSRRTKMGQVLSTYVSRNHESYDGSFLLRLMASRPDWFVEAAVRQAA